VLYEVQKAVSDCYMKYEQLNIDKLLRMCWIVGFFVCLQEWIFKKWDGGMDWIDLAHDRDRWLALVNAVMNLRVSRNSGNFLTS
jgi:hypothetical protein